MRDSDGILTRVLENRRSRRHRADLLGGRGRRNGQVTRFEYDAFLSYSHRADTSSALALHHALHHFAKPWYRLRALRVFRDDSSLGANPALWDSIEEALSSARFLVLLACRQSAQSPWVAKEVEYWCTHRDLDHLLVVLTDPVDDASGTEARLAWDTAKGEINWEQTTALPACLRGRFRDEPRFVDLGWARSRPDLSLHDPAFREAVADLAAPLWGRPKDQLIGEDVRQHSRTLRWVRGTVALLAVLALLASAAAVIAVRQRNTAQAKTATAEARLYAAQAQSAADPYAAVALAVAAEQRTASPLAEARAAFAAAAQRATTWTTRLVGGLARKPLTVSALTWSGDGSQVLLAAEDGSVRRWSIRTGQTAQVVTAAPRSDPQLNTASWAANRTTLTTVRSDGSVVIRDIQSPDARVALSLGGDVWYADLSPDGRTLAADDNGVVRRWDARTGRAIGASLQGPRGLLPHVAWSPDGSRLASIAVGLQIWNASTGRPLLSSVGGDEWWSLAWSPDGSRLAVGGEHGAVRLWDGRTGRAVGPVLAGHQRRVWDLAWSPDGRYLASAGDEGTIRIWDMATEKIVGPPLSFDGQTSAVRVAWSPDSRLLVGAFGLTQNSPQLLRLWRVAKPPAPGHVLHGPVGPVMSTAWSPDGRHIAGGDKDGTLWTWDARTGRGTSGSPPGNPGDQVTIVTWSPDGRQLASASDSGIRVWTTSGEQSSPVAWWASGGVLTLAWSADGARVASGDRLGAVRVWSVATGRPVGRTFAVGSRTDVVRWIAWLPGGRRLAVGLASGGVEQWDVASTKRLGNRLQTSPQAVQTMAWSPLGDVLAVAGGGDTIGLWRVDSGRLIRTIRAADVVVGALAWSADGSRLASAGSSGNIQVWDVVSGALLGQMVSAQAPGVASLTWSPNGSELASGGLDNTVRLWRSTTERQACQEARSELELTPETRSSAPFGLEVCSHTDSVRAFPPIPVLPATEGFH